MTINTPTRPGRSAEWPAVGQSDQEDTGAMGKAALAMAAMGYHILPMNWTTADGVCSCGKGCNPPGKHH